MSYVINHFISYIITNKKDIYSYIFNHLNIKDNKYFIHDTF